MPNAIIIFYHFFVHIYISSGYGMSTPLTFLTSTFKGNLNDRSIDPGKTDELKFHFQNNVALTGYSIVVNFGPAGTVTITVP